MSEAGTLFKRYVWLIDTVQTGHWTKEDLMRKWLHSSLNDGHEEMADKTFHNHIKVTGNQAKYVRSVPLHTSQTEEEGGSDKCTVFSYRLKPTFDFMQEIFSHADDFEVLEPKWLCDEISRRVYNMCKYYRKEESQI